MRVKSFALVIVCVAAGCSSSTSKPSRDAEDLVFARAAIAQTMLDPKSVDFRNERIRTIWSSNGDFNRVYCGEVNANNTFGGRAGFKPAHVVLATRGSYSKDHSYDPDGPFVRGKSYVESDEGLDPNFYLDCVRPDTQRKNGDVFTITLGGYESPEQMRVEMNRSVPLISNRAFGFQ